MNIFKSNPICPGRGQSSLAHGSSVGRLFAFGHQNDIITSTEAVPAESEYGGFEPGFVLDVHEFIAHSQNKDTLAGGEFNQAFFRIQCG